MNGTTYTPELSDQTKAGTFLEIEILVGSFSFPPMLSPLPGGHFLNKLFAHRFSFEGLCTSGELNLRQRWI